MTTTAPKRQHKCTVCKRYWTDLQKHRGDCPHCGAHPVGRGHGRTVVGKPPAAFGKPDKPPKRKGLPGGISHSQQRWRETFAQRTGYLPDPGQGEDMTWLGS